MTDEAKTSWTIKSMLVETRLLAIACAAKRGETMGQWIDRAIKRQADIEAGDRIEPARFEPSLPAVKPAPETGNPISMTELRQAMEAAAAVSTASGVQVPKTTARHAYALLTQRLREGRGLPPLAPRQTRARIGQTIEAELPE
jgi:hypothetical protein